MEDNDDDDGDDEELAVLDGDEDDDADAGAPGGRAPGWAGVRAGVAAGVWGALGPLAAGRGSGNTLSRSCVSVAASLLRAAIVASTAPSGHMAPTVPRSTASRPVAPQGATSGAVASAPQTSEPSAAVAIEMNAATVSGTVAARPPRAGGGNSMVHHACWPAPSRPDAAEDDDADAGAGAVSPGAWGHQGPVHAPVLSTVTRVPREGRITCDAGRTHTGPALAQLAGTIGQPQGWR
jgi:hypothetical protein